MDNQQGASAQQGQLPLDQQQPYKGLVRPQQIQNFHFLGPDKKQSYQNGISSLWQSIHNHPQDSPDHVTALKKLVQISRALMTDLRKHQAAQSTGQAGGQPPAASQSAPRPSSQGQAPTQQQQPQQQQQTQAQQQSNTQASAPASNAGQNQAATAAPRQAQQPVQQPGQQPQAGANREMDTPEKYTRQVEGMSWTAIPNPPQGTPDTYLAEIKRRYAAALWRKDTHQNILQKIATQEQQLQQASQQVPPGLAVTKTKNQSGLQGAINFIEGINKQQRELKVLTSGAQHAASSQAQGGGATQPSMPAQVAGQQRLPMPSGNQGQSQSGTGMQANSSAPANGGGNASQMQGNNPPRLPQANGSQMGPGQASFNAPRPLPGPAGPSYTGGQTQSPQTTMAPQGPVPYSHQSAINAARSHSNPQIPQPNSARPEGQNAFGRAEAGERQTKPTYGSMKGWIPQAPQPVPMGAARPTLTGSSNGMSGMMGQPAISQKPEFSLHGQGDRVLDKKKLDELVRQVAGAGGREHQSLQPDVEESMLSLADEFVDNVITSACRLAKARGSGQLELRDLQVVIERYYNIRIPGYALDDNRTVRKVQPSPTYLQKMNAVQAAKVMGGKTDI